MARTGVLLINIGTPDEPTPEAVGRYLRQFLMDEYVLDMPFIKRWLLVNRVIVPRRKHYSAQHYQKVQMAEGSPLLVYTQRFAAGLIYELSGHENQYAVEIGMRYGNPSIASGLKKLNDTGVDRVVAAPLYPQYTQSSFETAVAATKKQAKTLGLSDALTFVDPFYVDAGFIDVYAHVLAEHVNAHTPDYTLFSFHSVPVRHIKQIDKADYCRVNETCCERIGIKNANCYRAQCHATARAIAAAVGLRADKYMTCFQSQLGKDEWIGPAFEDVLIQLAKRGIKTVAVACPSFVADCLETLEEIGIRGREEFREAGGGELTLVPSLNSDPLWIKAAANLISKTGAAATQAAAASVTASSGSA